MKPVSKGTWAPKTMKHKGFGHLKTRLFTIKTSKNVCFGAPWYITWQLKTTFCNKKCIFKWWVFYCYISLPESRYVLFVFSSFFFCLQLTTPGTTSNLCAHFGENRNNYFGGVLWVIPLPGTSQWQMIRFSSGSAETSKCQMSHEKNPYYFPLYWLVYRDPYNGLL